jgi:hypothetical protein
MHIENTNGAMALMMIGSSAFDISQFSADPRNALQAPHFTCGGVI